MSRTIGSPCLLTLTNRGVRTGWGQLDARGFPHYQAASSTDFRFFQPLRNKDASVNLLSKPCT